MKNQIFIIHNGKANYPEIAAYREYFASEYEVLDGDLDAYQAIENKSNCIAWCIMGFFPNKIEAKQVIHDYRSLSVGRLPALKDQVKRIFNAKPNLRIFQNTIMEDAMAFNDGIGSCILPMGVPEYIFELAKEKSRKYLAKYCYIGEISFEREINLVLEAFIDNDIKGDFVLIGEPESRLYEKFSKYENIRFVGRKPQSETLRMVKQCEFAVCSLPYHRPYSFQAATKLLEYLALGMKVICNPAPSNKMVCDNLNAGEVFMSSKYIFDNTVFEDEIATKMSCNSSGFSMLGWREVIYSSNISSHLHLSSSASK